ncbi:MAG: hypothetical protein EXR77_18765 [Myxococcales bacterium]|nr:hypothetical protein [Myxococcales bacterium]
MRKPHSRDWWRASVANWQASGQTAATFAQTLDVDAKSLQWWRQWLVREDAKAKRPPSRFVEGEVTAAAPAAAQACPAATVPPQSLSAQIGVVQFDIVVGTDPAYLAELFAAVGKALVRC